MDLIIVDDEPLARDRLQRLVTALGHDVVGMAGHSNEAMALVHQLDPTVILLDIEMPGGTGLDMAEEVAQLDNPPAIIFTTAYEEYAIDAFATIAAGYLMKPIKSKHIEQALVKAQGINKAQLEVLSAKQKPAEQHITVRSHRGVDLVRIDSIRCFLADSKYITVVSTDGEFLMDGTLKQLETDFASCFTRVHRNALVSIPHITGLGRATEGHYMVHLDSVEQQPVVSRRYASKVKSLLERL